ncbi:MAG: hypothetical protein AUJ57_00800 [Zetaproteobacteria bacterium CG1_02_53_45]|nr:MAG: hypothetical protein AUJ57_00800 [Zetaproteobacteria bacterium CG1_02_53_45]
MSCLIPHLLILHSAELEARLNDEAEATGQTKSKTARSAIDTGIPRALEMSRAEILVRSQHIERLTKLPRAGVWLERQTEKVVFDFANDLKIPKWKIYSLAIDVGMDIWSEFFRLHTIKL